jgi:hypothetical protein
VKATPTERFICHCLYCQAFVGKPFTDVTVLRAKDVVLTNADQASFKKYYFLPPNLARERYRKSGKPDRGRFCKCADLARGSCRKCGKPFVESIGFGAFKYIFIPSGNFERQELLPAANMHTLYRLREKDSPDDLPKHYGFLSSQLAIIRMIMRTLVTIGRVSDPC